MMYDVAVVGRGPSGLSAAINARVEGLRVLCIGKHDQSQAWLSTLIENYPGFESGVDGSDLLTRMTRQAKRLGVEFVSAHITEVIPGEVQRLIVGDSSVTASNVVIASGLTPKTLEVCDNCHYGARVADPEWESTGPCVAVLGGANSAGQAALWLAGHGKMVDLVSRSPLEKAMSAYLVERISNEPNIVLTKQPRPGEETFVYVGMHPNCPKIEGLAMDERGRVIVDQDFQTNLPGIAAVGDCTTASGGRVAASVGHGSECIAAMLRRH